MRTLLIFAFLFVLLVPTVFAVDSLEFKFGRNESLTTIGPDTRLQVQLIATGTTDASTFDLRADLSQLNKNAQLSPELMNVPFACELSEGSFRCTASMQLWPGRASVEIPFTLIEDDVERTQTYQQDFTFDNTRPRAISFQTNYRYLDMYAVRSNGVNNFTFQFEDSVGSFSLLRNVWFAVGSETRGRAGFCEGLTCSGFAAPDCPSGGQEQVQIVYPSTDDAGNAVQSASFSVLCDARPPELVEPENPISVGIQNVDDYFTTPKTGDTIELSVLVFDDATGVQAQLNASGLIENDRLLDATCVPSNENTRIFNCSWMITDILDGSHELELFIRDSVNRTMNLGGESLQFDLQVDEYDLATDVETPLFFLPTVGTSPASQGYNRIAIDLALDNGLEYPLFATFTPKRSNVVASDLEILYTHIDPYECSAVNARGTEVSARKIFSEIEIARPELNYDVGTAQRINFVLTSVDVNTIPDELILMCNVTSMVRADGITYANPTHYLLNIPLKFSNTALNSQHIGEKYAQQIKEKEDRIDGTLSKTISIFNKAAATLSSVCDLKSVLDSVGMTGEILKVAGIVLNAIVVNLGEPVYQSGSQIQVQVDKLKDDLLGDDAENAPMKFINTACKYMTCSLDNNAQNSDNWYFSGAKPVEDFLDFGNGDADATGFQGFVNDFNADLTSGLSVPNPRESIVSSIMTQCWPGVLYHVNRYRESSCETLLCMKEMSRLGMDATVCHQAQSQFICQEIVGEAFEAVPYTRVAENLVENVQAMAKNILPNTLKYVIDNSVCDNFVSRVESNDDPLNKGLVFLCSLPKAVGSVLNTNVNKNGNAGAFVYPSTVDICAQALCNDPRGCETKYSSLLHNYNPVRGVRQNLLAAEDHTSNQETIVNEAELARAQSSLKNNQEDLESFVNEQKDLQEQIALTENELRRSRNEKISLEEQRRTLQNDLDIGLYAGDSALTDYSRIDAIENQIAAIDKQLNALESDISSKENSLNNDNVKLDNTNKNIEHKKREETLIRNNIQRITNGLSPIDLHSLYEQEKMIFSEELEYIKEQEQAGVETQEMSILAEETAAVNTINDELATQRADNTIMDKDAFLESRGLDARYWRVKKTDGNTYEIVPNNAYSNRINRLENDIGHYNRVITELNKVNAEADDLTREQLIGRIIVSGGSRPGILDSLSDEELRYRYVRRKMYEMGKTEKYIEEFESADGSRRVVPKQSEVQKYNNNLKDLEELELQQERVNQGIETPIVLNPKSIGQLIDMNPELELKGINTLDYELKNGVVQPTEKREQELAEMRDFLRSRGYSNNQIKKMISISNELERIERDLRQDLSSQISTNELAMEKNTERINEIDKRMKEINIEENNLPVDDPAYIAYGEERERLQTEKQALENENNDLQKTNDEYRKTLKDSEAVSKEKLLEQIAINEEIRENMEQNAISLATVLYNYNLLDWMVSTNWGSDGSSYNQFIESTLDTDAWKAGICGPLTRTSSQGQIGNTGAALQCEGSTCKPVLSQAAERLTIDEESYLYTMVFVVGPYDGRTNYEYQVYVEEETGVKRLLFEENTLIVSPMRTETTERSFISKRKYTEVCIEFLSGVYPPGETNARREFCRPIIDSTQGASAFDTGSPLSTAQVAAGGSSSSALLNNAGISNDI